MGQRSYKDIVSKDIGRKTEFEFLCALVHMTSVLKRAVLGSVQGHRDRIKVKASKHRMWNDTIDKAVKRSIYIWWDWKKGGSSTDGEHLLNVQRERSMRKIYCNERLLNTRE